MKLLEEYLTTKYASDTANLVAKHQSKNKPLF